MKLNYWKAKNGKWYYEIRGRNNFLVLKSKGYRRRRSLLESVAQFIYLTPQFVRKT